MYTAITIQEMEDFLKTDKGWVQHTPLGQEIHFDFHKGPYTIRVFSSIPSGGVSRECGKDAIRVIITTVVDGEDKGIKKFPRVTRQANWRKYLKLRVMEAFTYISTIKACSLCNSPLVLRTVKATNKEFYGCTRFPLCKYTERIS